MPRAASTTLQRGLFSDATLFGGFGVGPARERLKPWREYGLGTPIPVAREELDTFGTTLRAAEARSAGRPFVISDEGFLSSYTRLVDQEAFARRIAHVDPQARVLLVIREQTSLLVSRYRQLKAWKAWATVGAGLPPGLAKDDRPRQLHRMPRFDQWVSMGIESGPLTSFSNLQYDTIHHIYARELSPAQVHVAVFEELEQDLPAFARRLSGVLDVDPAIIVQRLTGKAYNVSTATKARRRVRSPFVSESRLGWSNALRLHSHRLSGGGFTPHFSAAAVERSRARYGQENRRRAERLDLPLDRYGYLM